jgi:hypothetical protein
MPPPPPLVLSTPLSTLSTDHSTLRDSTSLALMPASHNTPRHTLPLGSGIYSRASHATSAPRGGASLRASDAARLG